MVAESVASQLADASAESTRNNIMGVMIESNLVEGNQKIPAEGPEGLVYGKSVRQRHATPPLIAADHGRLLALARHFIVDGR